MTDYSVVYWLLAPKVNARPDIHFQKLFSNLRLPLNIKLLRVNISRVVTQSIRLFTTPRPVPNAINIGMALLPRQNKNTTIFEMENLNRRRTPVRQSLITSKITFPLAPGDTVQLPQRPHEHGYSNIKITHGNRTTIVKSGTTKMISPVMVVTEVVREDPKSTHLYDENTGKLTKDLFKACCVWFSTETGQFHERWFNSGILSKIETAEVNKINTEINSLVILKTAIFANRQTTEELRLALSPDDSGIDGQYHVTRTFDTLDFFPPKMVVTGISKRNPMPALFDKSSGETKRALSDLIVKCIWYNYRNGKFSEHEFSPDVLMNLTDLPTEEEILKIAMKLEDDQADIPMAE